MSYSVAIFVLAGLVAKGFGAIAIIFGLGLLVGVILTLGVGRRLRR